jgi:hypothetical protein
MEGVSRISTQCEAKLLGISSTQKIDLVPDSPKLRPNTPRETPARNPLFIHAAQEMRFRL